MLLALVETYEAQSANNVPVRADGGDGNVAASQRCSWPSRHCQGFTPTILATRFLGINQVSRCPPFTSFSAAAGANKAAAVRLILISDLNFENSRFARDQRVYLAAGERAAGVM